MLMVPQITLKNYNLLHTLSEMDVAYYGCVDFSSYHSCGYIICYTHRRKWAVLYVSVDVASDYASD
jgi:hypothetical protein